MEWVYIIGGFLLLIIGCNVVLFNHFIQLRVKLKEAESNVKVVLKRRADLIGILANVAKSYAQFETEVFQSVTLLRKNLFADSNETYGEVENSINVNYKILLAVSEQTPQIKSDQIFVEVQEEILHNENLILGSRRYFNSLVLKWNTHTQLFPFIIIAKIFNFTPVQFYSYEDKEYYVSKFGAPV